MMKGIMKLGRDVALKRAIYKNFTQNLKIYLPTPLLGIPVHLLIHKVYLISKL